MGTEKSGNTREQRIRRWLDAMANGPTAWVSIEVTDSETKATSELARLPMADDTTHIAESLCGVLQDAADELGRTLNAAVVAYDADGERLFSKLVQGRPATKVLPGSPADLDGSETASRAMQQRHYEAMMRIRISESNELRAAYSDMLETQARIIDRLSTRLDREETRSDEMRELVQVVEDGYRQAMAEQEEENASQGMDPAVQQLAMHVFGRLMAKSSAPAKAAPTSEPDPPGEEAGEGA